MRSAFAIVVGLLLFAAPALAQPPVAEPDRPLPWTAVDDSALGEMAFAPVEGLDPWQVVEDQQPISREEAAEGVITSFDKHAETAKEVAENPPSEDDSDMVACEGFSCLVNTTTIPTSIPSPSGFTSPVTGAPAQIGVPAQASQALSNLPVNIPLPVSLPGN